ncbi:LL-diaminopimelate aminotransferase [Sporomusa termitida]|uniref:LL-diaminopimelate aminotransferase n=1 Tax=Sporomusa termitida TaxID=2377 RepID=A0A517DZ60_9FIRM|nr:LL-diaminopimelate aminotransferase [Sporomusa termitida]QDR82644.1 LL-diaminopimelate aminotransferase [Sporomusa termitida]
MAGDKSGVVGIMLIETAQRIDTLPEYLFAKLDKIVARKKEQGIDIINLGIGDPDQPTPEHIIEELYKEAKNPANHRYSSSIGILPYRQAVSQWYADRFGVRLDAKTQVASVIGSKEGIFHISWSFLNPGDVVLLCDIHYPVYRIGALMAGAVPYYMPVNERNNYLPDLGSIPADIAKKAKLLFVNYPNNPTGAIAGETFFHELIAFARDNNIIVCHDGAYSEIYFDDYRPPSFLQFPGAKEVGVEFSSVSKAYNMTGWRSGWIAGNAEVVEALTRLKSNIDTGQFQAIQYAAIAGLNTPPAYGQSLRNLYQERRDLVVDGLNRLGWKLEKPKAAFYLWAPVPTGYTALSFSEMVLDKAGVVVTPGTGYGQGGEGFFRISLTTPTNRILEAISRISRNIDKAVF